MDVGTKESLHRRSIAQYARAQELYDQEKLGGMI
jgi:hypothetical protein